MAADATVTALARRVGVPQKPAPICLWRQGAPAVTLAVMETLLELQPNQPLPLARHGNLRLTVQSGCVWLTRANDARDYFLTPGQRMAILAADMAVAESHGNPPARLSLTPMAAPRARRPLQAADCRRA